MQTYKLDVLHVGVGFGEVGHAGHLARFLQKRGLGGGVVQECLAQGVVQPVGGLELVMARNNWHCVFVNHKIYFIWADRRCVTPLVDK